jgi:hypothetical protein
MDPIAGAGTARVILFGLSEFQSEAVVARVTHLQKISRTSCDRRIVRAANAIWHTDSRISAAAHFGQQETRAVSEPGSCSTTMLRG